MSKWCPRLDLNQRSPDYWTRQRVPPSLSVIPDHLRNYPHLSRSRALKPTELLGHILWLFFKLHLTYSYAELSQAFSNYTCGYMSAFVIQAPIEQQVYNRQLNPLSPPAGRQVLFLRIGTGLLSLCWTQDSSHFNLDL